MMCFVYNLWSTMTIYVSVFFFNDTATTEIYTYGHTLSLHDALPISEHRSTKMVRPQSGSLRRISESLSPGDGGKLQRSERTRSSIPRSEEHTSELQSLMRIPYAVFCLKKKNHHHILHIPFSTHTHSHPLTKNPLQHHQ